MKIRSNRKQSVRLQIAQEAARLLATFEAADFASARRKAAAHLKSRNQRHLPDNQEIEQALRDYQQLFDGAHQERSIDSMRRQAIEAMERLGDFSPRLTGDVLSGTANLSSSVQLYLFNETPEQLQIRLLEMRIPAMQGVVTLLHANGDHRRHDRFEFQAGTTRFELILLSPNDRSNPPLDPVTSKPSLGASLAQAKRLLV